MKSPQKGYSAVIVLVVIIILAAIAGAGYVVVSKNKDRQGGGTAAQRARVAQEKAKVERTVTAQLKPLRPQLAAMGYSNLTDLKTDCEYYAVRQPDPDSLEDSWESPGEHFRCSSGIDRLIKVPADKPKFIRQASDLDKTLLAEGWKLESDRPTSVWAEKLSNGVAQADQSYSKKVEGLDCGLQFWSAFSSPEPPATSVVVSCGEYE